MMDQANDRSYQIFSAIRTATQELHPEMIFSEEPGSAPFLFKSRDEDLWARIFYEPMKAFSSDDLKKEIKRLFVLMGSHGRLYLFYPFLEESELLKIEKMTDRVQFFEYFVSNGVEGGAPSVVIRKGSRPLYRLRKESKTPPVYTIKRPAPSSFLQQTALTKKEIVDLAELGLALKQLS